MHIKYKWQRPPNKVVAYSDGDWAGCTLTRKSTSGGVLMHGCHCDREWHDGDLVLDQHDERMLKRSQRDRS